MSSQRDFRDLAPERDTNSLLRAIAQTSDDDELEATPLIGALLSHPDPDVRQEVLRKLAVHWKNQNYRQDVCEALTSDPDEGVRATAAFGLATLTTSETMEADTRLLLPLVRSQQSGPDLRLAAYEALLLIRGRRDLPPLDPRVDPDDVIDWKWLNTVAANGDS